MTLTRRRLTGTIRGMLLAWAACAALMVSGCFSSCDGCRPAPPPAPPAVAAPGAQPQTPVTPPGPQIQTPTTPPGSQPQTPVIPPGAAVQSPPAPVAQSPTTPLPAPDAPPEGEGLPPEGETPQEGEDAPPEEEKPVLSMDAMKSIAEGMTYEEVQAQIGDPGVLVSGNSEKTTLYRWSEGGINFLARFENGVLKRKNLMFDGKPVRNPSPELKKIDQSIYDSVREGMTYEQVMSLIGMDAQPITKSGENVAIYKWADAQGSSFTARFENDTLTRKNGLYIAPKPAEEPAAAEGGAEEGETAGDDAEEPEPEEEDGVTMEDLQRIRERNASREEAYEEPAPEEPARGETPPAAETTRGGKVKVAGATRREREKESGDPNAGRSYKPRAELPKFPHSLRNGNYEIRVNNISDSDVKAVVLSDEGGIKLDIGAGGRRSAKVNQGTFVLYFIYDDDPYTLHRGGAIPIGQWMTDMEVTIIGESYDVRVLDRSGDSNSSSRNRRRR